MHDGWRVVEITIYHLAIPAYQMHLANELPQMTHHGWREIQITFGSFPPSTRWRWDMVAKDIVVLGYGGKFKPLSKDIVVLGYGGKFKPLSVLSHQAPGRGRTWLLRTLLSLVTAGNSNHFQFFPTKHPVEVGHGC
jgi:hypothetical protein